MGAWQREVLAKIEYGPTQLLYSQELLDEIIDVSSRPKMRRYDLDVKYLDILERVLRLGTKVQTLSKINLCPDPKDDYLLALARDGQATHLITGDKDPLELNPFGQTQIVLMTDYLAQ